MVSSSETLAAVRNCHVVNFGRIGAHSWHILLLLGDDSSVGLFGYHMASLLRVGELVDERAPTHVGLRLLDLIRGAVGLLCFLGPPVFLPLRGRNLVSSDARLDNRWLFMQIKTVSKSDLE